MTIHNAVEKGKIEVVRHLLHDDPLLVNSRNASNDAPLHVAAWHKKTKIVKILLDAGADVNSRGDQGKTPLHYAVLSDSKPIVELLIQKGADAQLRNDAGVSPVYLAASTENRKLVDLFVKLGQPIDIASSIYVDGPDAVLAKLKENSEALKSVPQFENLLWDAIRLQSVDLAGFLLDHGAKPNQKINGTYPLMDAIAHKNEQLVKLLLEKGADVSTKDHVGRSILRYCEVYGVPPGIIDLLQKRGAS